MYRKEITHLIIECWGKGLSAEETREFIQRKKDILIGLATVYRHRHSITGQKIVDELFRSQRRDIALEENGETRMKYRNELLKILIPQRIESLSIQKIEQTVKIDATEDEDKILSRAAAILTRKRRFGAVH